MSDEQETTATKTNGRRGGKFHEIAHKIAALLEEKNKAYGNSFDMAGKFLELLYPEGVKPEQYHDMLTLVRIFDKLKRIATDKDAFSEDPYQDVVGYGILALNAREPRRPLEQPAISCHVDDSKNVFVLEKVQDDGICVYLANPGTRQWTTKYVEAHQFPTRERANWEIGQSDARVVPVSKNKML